jgi:hypothetical protein
MRGALVCLTKGVKHDLEDLVCSHMGGDLLSPSRTGQMGRQHREQEAVQGVGRVLEAPLPSPNLKMYIERQEALRGLGRVLAKSRRIEECFGIYKITSLF